MVSSIEITRTVIVVSGGLGARIRATRERRKWSLRKLAAAAGLAPSFVHWVETGHTPSVETYARLAQALGLRLEMDLVDPRRTTAQRDADVVHAAMGEALATQLAKNDFALSLDEPYQHFQFAGRADLVAWDVGRAALLHIENRTRLPNFQEAAGAYNAKRRWLAPSISERLGMRGFRSVSHAFVGVWSAEMLHAVRMRRSSLAAICPDPLAPLERWLAGEPPEDSVTSSFALLDPIARGRSDRRTMIDLETALRPSTRPRYRGYAHVVEELRGARLA
ncbi:MAG TPA: helix-turn-helix transcriptional regulator [Candidatus Limnocylindrales bacterium]|nr:helix-turn-helix transcriptional regulator [Candidatus Limnocylindrales bacterium]